MTIEALNFFFGGKAVRAVSARASSGLAPQDNNGAGFAGAAAAAAAASCDDPHPLQIVDELVGSSSPATEESGKDKIVDETEEETQRAPSRALRESAENGRQRLLIVAQGTCDDIQPLIALGTHPCILPYTHVRDA
jgi:hypothetical protein